MSRPVYVAKDGTEISQEEALEAFANNEERIIASDQVNGHHVSTVWLVINHAFTDDRPIQFETMIFSDHEGCELDHNYQQRYSTETDAKKGHKRAMEAARNCPP